MTSLSSTNREKFQKIGRNDRLLHPEDRKKKQSLARLFSNWDKKKKNTHTKNSHWSDCYLLSILRIWLVNLKYTWSCCHCIPSLHLSEVSGIFDLCHLSLSKWKCYVIWHIQKNENCQDNCPSRLSGRLSCHYEEINTQVSDRQRFPCFLAERTWEKTWYFTTFFHVLHGYFNCSFTYEVSAAV